MVFFPPHWTEKDLCVALLNHAFTCRFSRAPRLVPPSLTTGSPPKCSRHPGDSGRWTSIHPRRALGSDLSVVFCVLSDPGLSLESECPRSVGTVGLGPASQTSRCRPPPRGAQQEACRDPQERQSHGRVAELCRGALPSEHRTCTAEPGLSLSLCTGRYTRAGLGTLPPILTVFPALLVSVCLYCPSILPGLPWTAHVFFTELPTASLTVSPAQGPAALQGAFLHLGPCARVPAGLGTRSTDRSALCEEAAGSLRGSAGMSRRPWDPGL